MRGASPSFGQGDGTGHPFSLGVASGDPSDRGVVLWTRLCRGPLDPGTDQSVDVTWELALDAGFERVIQTGNITAHKDRAHCVHVFADGLNADTRYFYRFIANGEASPIGSTKTLPPQDSQPERFRVAMTSCQEYSSGYFTAYRDLVAQRPDLVFQTGDYIYETAAGSVRPLPFDWGESVTLEHYRALYALYRQDADLRRAHATAPWVVIWDDHEVVNDWGPGHFLPSPYNSEFPSERHPPRIAAARRAYLEHMPLRASAVLYGAERKPLYHQIVVGDLLELTLLDVRSYRDAPVCNGDNALTFTPCPAANAEARSMLGREQENWLYRHFGARDCRWNALGQTTVFAPYNRGSASEAVFETDSWDNYAANRSRVLAHIAARKLRNVVSLAGNIHAYYLGDLGDDDAATDRNPLMSEIVTTSISAGGGGDARYREANKSRAINTGLRYFDNRYRGYTLLDINRSQINGILRVMRSVADPSAAAHTLARFRILDGTNSAQIGKINSIT